MSIQGPLTSDAVLAAFNDHLRRVRGVCPEVRQTYGRFAQAFLQAAVDNRPLGLCSLTAGDVVAFVTDATSRYQPSTVQVLASALRSFLRFARTEGLMDARLDEAVPAVRRHPAPLPRHLGSSDLARDEMAAVIVGGADPVVFEPGEDFGERGEHACSDDPAAGDLEVDGDVEVVEVVEVLVEVVGVVVVHSAVTSVTAARAALSSTMDAPVA
jgi:hypothetical protein